MTASVAFLLFGFAVCNVLLVLWSQWSTRHRVKRVHDRLDILSRDLGELQARVSVSEQERRWQEEVRKFSEKY